MTLGMGGAQRITAGPKAYKSPCRNSVGRMVARICQCRNYGSGKFHGCVSGQLSVDLCFSGLGRLYPFLFLIFHLMVTLTFTGHQAFFYYASTFVFLLPETDLQNFVNYFLKETR